MVIWEQLMSTFNAYSLYNTVGDYGLYIGNASRVYYIFREDLVNGERTSLFTIVSEGTHEEMTALKKLLEAGDADQT